MELFYDPLGLICNIFSVITPFVTALKTKLSEATAIDLMIIAGEDTHKRSNINRYL